MVQLPSEFYSIVSYNALYFLIAAIFSATWLIERIATVVDESFQKWVRLVGAMNIIIGFLGLIFLIPSTAILIVDGPNNTLDWSIIATLGLIIIVLSIRAVQYMPTRSLISLGVSVGLFAVTIFLTTQNIFIPGLSLIIFSASFLIGKMIQDILEIVTSILSNPIITISVSTIALAQTICLFVLQKTILTVIGIYI